ncbi:MAG: ABC transporter ATP-binding protein [Chloroflexi bacterium]|nr:ABC transporter ATP-binding protein [Chloroflexota bacterium]
MIRPSAAEFSITRSWQADRRGPVHWILSHVLRHKIYIAGVFVGALGNALGAGAIALYVGQAFELMTQSPDFRALGWIAFWLIVSQIIRGVLMLGRNFCSEVIGQRVERDTRDELYLNLLGKSMSFHDGQATGDLMARATNDVREINMMFNPGLNMVIGSANFMIAPFILVPYIHPQLLVTPSIYAVVYIFLLRGYLMRLRPATESVRREFGRLNATLAEAIDGIETVKGAAQESEEISRFDQALSLWRNAFVWQGDVEAKFFPLLLMGLLQAAGLLHSLILYQWGQLDVGQVVAFNAMLLLFQFPTFISQFAYSQVSSGISSARRVLELLNTETELDQNVGGYEGPMDGNIQFDHVTFGYNGASPALTDASFCIKPGQTVAIVGQTGAGKSTIAKLINRTYDVNGGQIIIGGVNVRDWNLEALRKQISIIEQDIYLFSRTVAENIAFGYPEATRAEIEAAAKAAQAHDFIMNFADGYETVVGERGVTLSGGQRQRLALARAFLTNPRILILDDSTSAIDSATEDKIQRAIERAAEWRTTLLITHRLSQIRWADLIVVLRKGCVAMVGDHETLLRESEAYRNLFARYET